MKIIVFDIISFDYPVLWAPLLMFLLLLPSKVRIKVLEKSIMYWWPAKIFIKVTYH